MSDLAKARVAVVDSNKPRCEAMAQAIALTAEVCTWSVDPTAMWKPETPAPNTIQLVICHFGTAERKVVDQLKGPTVVFYSGGGGGVASGEFVIWREVTGAHNAITATEARELLEFFSLGRKDQTPDRVPDILRLRPRYLLHSLAILCQAYLDLDHRLHGADQGTDECDTLANDRMFCVAQFERLQNPDWWHSIFGAIFPLKQIEDYEWNSSRGDARILTEFAQQLARCQPLPRTLVNSLYLELTRQLRS